MTNLNLGCFNKKLPGFINIDIREEVSPDIVDNCFTLNKFKSESVDLIYSCHMLEHLSPEESDQALARWFRILKPGGTLRLAVPDVEKACLLYLLTKNINLVKTIFWGSQKHDFDYHKNGWDFESLKIKLIENGFSAVHRWNWWEIEPHSFIDDYSQSYWPRKDILYQNGKIVDVNGILLSLNVECVK